MLGIAGEIDTGPDELPTTAEAMARADAER